MDKRCGNQDTSTEVFAEEEDWRWDLHPLDFLGHYWETGTKDRRKEDNDCVELMDCYGRRIDHAYKLRQRAGGNRTQRRQHRCHTPVSRLPL